MRFITEPAWKKYFRAYAKKQATDIQPHQFLEGDDEAEELQYGTEIYQTPKIPKSLLGEFYYLQWVVTEYEGEFNIFIQRSKGRKSRREFVCAFKWRETALKYALEMLLACTGKLTRRGIQLSPTDEAALPA